MYKLILPPCHPYPRSVALSLLLVFRTDASYARWMEALALWSEVRTTCTDLINDAAAWVEEERHRDLVVDWWVGDGRLSRRKDSGTLCRRAKRDVSLLELIPL